MTEKKKTNRRIVTSPQIDAKASKSLADLIGEDLNVMVSRDLQVEIERAANREEVRKENTIAAAIKRGKASAKRAFKKRYQGQLEALELEAEKLLDELEKELAQG